MGSCFSSASPYSVRTPTAKVVAVDGSLREYSVPVTVSSVLGAGQSCFLCDSDSLFFDTNISALDSEAVLELGHIYFVLPVAKLDHPLSGSDMAALAVKASSALTRVSKKRGKRYKIRIAPVEGIPEKNDGFERFNEFSVTKNEKRDNKLLPRPRPRNKVRLSTIQEGDG